MPQPITTHGCATRKEYEEYIHAVDVLIGAIPSRFCLPVGHKVETIGGSGVVAEKSNLGYIVTMDKSETCHNGVQLFFTPQEIRKWKKQ